MTVTLLLGFPEKLLPEKVGLSCQSRQEGLEFHLQPLVPSAFGLFLPLASVSKLQVWLSAQLFGLRLFGREPQVSSVTKCRPR